MGEEGLLQVLLLAAGEPDVVKRLEPEPGVHVVLLHQLVRGAAHLRGHGYTQIHNSDSEASRKPYRATERADEVVGVGEDVDILNYSCQRTV